MNIQDFWRIVSRRWWVVVLSTVLVSGGALLYARHQRRIYQATATVFAHPSGVTSPGDYSSDVGLLTYGTLADTFAALAQSKRLLDEAARSVGVTGDLSHTYTVSANTIAQTTVLEISVDGPDPALAARLANSLATQAAEATAQYYHIFALSPLDQAIVPSAPIRPQTSRDALYGTLAGLILGFIIAAFSVYFPALLDPPAQRRSNGNVSPLQWGASAVSSISIASRPSSGLASALTASRVAGAVQSGPSEQAPLLKRPGVPGEGGAPGFPSSNGALPHDGTAPEASRWDS